jgi:hypothetical protein
MTTRTTFRLAGLAAAIAVSLTVTSAALAKPVGLTGGSASSTGAVKVAGTLPSSVGMGGGSATINVVPSQGLSGPADSPANVGTPIIQSPVVRGDNPADIGTPASVPLTAPPAQAASSDFSWTDATIGALVGLAAAFTATVAAAMLRGRRGLALRI